MQLIVPHLGKLEVAEVPRQPAERASFGKQYRRTRTKISQQDCHCRPNRDAVAEWAYWETGIRMQPQSVAGR